MGCGPVQGGDGVPWMELWSQRQLVTCSTPFHPTRDWNSCPQVLLLISHRTSDAIQDFSLHKAQSFNNSSFCIAFRITGSQPKTLGGCWGRERRREERRAGGRARDGERGRPCDPPHHHDVIVIGGEGAGGEQAPAFVFHGIQGNAAPISYWVDQHKPKWCCLGKGGGNEVSSLRSWQWWIHGRAGGGRRVKVAKYF